MEFAAWALEVDRSDFTRTRFVDEEVPTPGEGEVLLRVDRVGVTANNVTYAVVGESMNYWSFFPANEGWGRVPLWGFADVAASNVGGIEAGVRFYGYLPPASHLLVKPERVNESGFRDSVPHRNDLPAVYNSYASTSADPAYEAEREDLQVLYRPLFFTSFVLDDFLGDNDFFGAETVVLSSASSKTAYGTAFCLGLRSRRPRLVGLTSAKNVGFTTGLGCYDEVLPYERVGDLPPDRTTVYVDITGDAALRSVVHAHLGDSLVHDALVGATHLDPSLGTSEPVEGVQPSFFFAPAQIAKRQLDWGRGEIEKRFGVAWQGFVPAVESWVDVQVGRGKDALRSAWLEVLSGNFAPRTGHVIAL